jgi:hypothetical protein
LLIQHARLLDELSSTWWTQPHVGSRLRLGEPPPALLSGLTAVRFFAATQGTP